MTDAPKYTIEDQIREVGREIGLRKAVYPKWVAAGRLTQADADAHLGKLGAAYATLKWIDKHQVRLREVAADLFDDHPRAAIENALLAVALAIAAHESTGENRGTITCPKCAGELLWSRATNGHYRGACKTAGCVQFI